MSSNFELSDTFLKPAKYAVEMTKISPCVSLDSVKFCPAFIKFDGK